MSHRAQRSLASPGGAVSPVLSPSGKPRACHRPEESGPARDPSASLGRGNAARAKSDLPVSTAELEAARLLLDRLGIRPEQLIGVPGPVAARAIPSVRHYLDQVADAVSPATRQVYGPYWRRIASEWGDRRIDDITPIEIKQLAERVRADVVVRRNSRGGRSAAEHLVSAMRCLYRHAVSDGLLAELDNPAVRVPKPRRLASTRRALPDTGLAEILNVVGRTGN